MRLQEINVKETDKKPRKGFQTFTCKGWSVHNLQSGMGVKIKPKLNQVKEVGWGTWSWQRRLASLFNPNAFCPEFISKCSSNNYRTFDVKNCGCWLTYDISHNNTS